MSATRLASPFRAHAGEILRAPNPRTLRARVSAARLAALAEFDLDCRLWRRSDATAK
jgi:hypothetical protein